MNDDFDATRRLLAKADPASHLSYDQNALTHLMGEVRAQALPRQDAPLQVAMESDTAANVHGSESSVNGWWRRHMRGLFTGATVLVVSRGLTAGGVAVNARTKGFGTPGSENGTSEMIFDRGTNYEQLVADTEPAGIICPAGLTAKDARIWFLSRFPQGQNMYQPEANIKAGYCSFAQGTWELMWKRALEVNDAAGQKAALDHIDEAVTCSNKLEIWGQGLYPFLMIRQAAARAGDPHPLLRDIDINTPVEFPAILQHVLKEAK